MKFFPEDIGKTFLLLVTLTPECFKQDKLFWNPHNSKQKNPPNHFQICFPKVPRQKQKTAFFFWKLRKGSGNDKHFFEFLTSYRFYRASLHPAQLLNMEGDHLLHLTGKVFQTNLEVAVVPCVPPQCVDSCCELRYPFLRLSFSHTQNLYATQQPCFWLKNADFCIFCILMPLSLQISYFPQLHTQKRQFLTAHNPVSHRWFETLCSFHTGTCENTFLCVDKEELKKKALRGNTTTTTQCFSHAWSWFETLAAFPDTNLIYSFAKMEGNCFVLLFRIKREAPVIPDHT